jgi:hypothetical protein
MFRRILIALGLRKKKEPAPKKKISTFHRLQRQSAISAVEIEAQRAHRRNQPPQ